MTSSTALAQNAELLREISGGVALVDWFGGKPEFADGEIIELRLDRSRPSLLRLALSKSLTSPLESSRVREFMVATFFLKDMIDVRLEGFCRQNVVGAVKLRRAPAKELDASLMGIGCAVPEMEIEIEPCAGAFGVIRATIERVSVEPPEYPNEKPLWAHDD